MKKLKDYTTIELEKLIADVVSREMFTYKSTVESMIQWWNGIEEKLQKEIDYPYKRREWFLRAVKKLKAEIDNFLKNEKNEK